MPAPIDTAPSIPFDLAAVDCAPAPRPVLDLDTMAAVTVDAGRAARQGRPNVHPADASPTIRARTMAGTRAAMREAAALSDLFRAAVRGAYRPGTE